MARLQKVKGERTLYRDPGSGNDYLRIYHEGRDTYRSLETDKIGQARQRMDARRAGKAAAKLALAVEPDEAAEAATVRDVIQKYQTDLRTRKAASTAWKFNSLAPTWSTARIPSQIQYRANKFAVSCHIGMSMGVN